MINFYQFPFRVWSVGVLVLFCCSCSMNSEVTPLYAQQNTATTPTNEGTLPASFPKYIDTGNPDQDARRYDAAKQVWIAANKDAYQTINDQAAQNAIDYSVPTPMPAQRESGDNIGNIPNKGHEITYEEREKARLAYEKAKAEAEQQQALPQETKQDQEVLTMFNLNKKLQMTPYLESIFRRMKESEFPGNMMQFDSKDEQKQARTEWIMQNEDLYQLFVWATQSTDGKIHLSDKEFQQLSPGLKKEIEHYAGNFVIE